MMHGDMGSMGGMMAWMMGIGLLGWVLVIALLVTIVVLLVRLLGRTKSGQSPHDPSGNAGRLPR
jgi:uncharacterized membrane protein